MRAQRVVNKQRMHGKAVPHPATRGCKWLDFFACFSCFQDRLTWLVLTQKSLARRPLLCVWSGVKGIY
jgi:hypothetical protein